MPEKRTNAGAGVTMPASMLSSACRYNAVSTSFEVARGSLASSDENASGARDEEAWEPLHPRQLAHIYIQRAAGFRDHAQRFGIEGDVGQRHAVDLGVDLEAVLALLVIGDGGGD